MMTRVVVWVLLATVVLLGGCKTLRPLGGAESCCDNPDECEWVVMSGANHGNEEGERLFLCCKSRARTDPRCIEVSWLEAPRNSRP